MTSRSSGGLRQGQVMSGQVALRHLARNDTRIAAQQDGCIVAGADGLDMALRRMSEPTPGTMFATVIIAVDLRDPAPWERCLAVAEAIADGAPGTCPPSAGSNAIVSPALAGRCSSPRRRFAGGSALPRAACTASIRDAALLAGLNDESPIVRAEALRTAGSSAGISSCPRSPRTQTPTRTAPFGRPGRPSCSAIASAPSTRSPGSRSTAIARTACAPSGSRCRP